MHHVWWGLGLAVVTLITLVLARLADGGAPAAIVATRLAGRSPYVFVTPVD